MKNSANCWSNWRPEQKEQAKPAFKHMLRGVLVGYCRPPQPIKLNRHAGNFLVRSHQTITGLHRRLKRNAGLLHVDHHVVQ